MMGTLSLARLGPSATLERKPKKNEPEEAGPGSKIQRLSCVLPVAAVTGIDFPSHSWLFQKSWTYDYRISSVDTKHGLEVPVSANQDEKELLLINKELGEPFPLV